MDEHNFLFTTEILICQSQIVHQSLMEEATPNSLSWIQVLIPGFGNDLNCLHIYPPAHFGYQHLLSNSVSLHQLPSITS